MILDDLERRRMRSTGITSKVVNSITFSISILFTLYTYRSAFSGKLLGDPFDSRLMIVLHEHWFRYFNGLVDLRNTEFFYPYKAALGYSDVFLVQGTLYSIFRFLSINLADSWMYTTLLLLLIGNLGWVVVANRYFKLYFVKIIFLLTIISSLSFVNYFALNPNIVGYSYLSWITLFYLNLRKETNRTKRVRKWSVFIIVISVYALSCWYGAFFFVLTVLIGELLSLVVTKRKIDFNPNFSDAKTVFPFLPIQIFFIWLFVYIYISVLNQPYRPTDEMITNSPRLKLLPNGGNVNGAELNGSIFRFLYEKFGLNYEQEYTIGVGLMVFIFGIFFLTKFIFEKHKTPSALIWTFSVIICYSFFIVYFDNISIHLFFFENIPGFNSIRYPSRYVIIVGYFAIFGIFYLVDKMLLKSSKFLSKLILISVLLLLVLDQQRSSYKGWDKELLINTDLFSQAEEIKAKCDYFYFDYPGGWWYDQIEAMTFGAQIGVPTVNGYSGAFPPNYPTEPFLSEKPPLKIFDWIAKIDKSERGCFITGRTPIRFIDKNLKSVDLVGFTTLETNGKDTWQWSVSPNPFLFIINYTKRDLQIEFEIKPASCLNIQDLRIFEAGDNELFQGEVKNTGEKLKFVLKFDKDIVKRIEIITKSSPCRFKNDPRDLFFEIKNLRYK
jgi:hypothetical protein